MSDNIFISHASKDDEFVRGFRVALESLQLPVWVDSRNLRGGNKLAPEIERIIEARHLMFTINYSTGSRAGILPDKNLRICVPRTRVIRIGSSPSLPLLGRLVFISPASHYLGGDRPAVSLLT